MFVEYNSTRQKEEKMVSAKSATRDRTGDGTDGKRLRTSNARRNGEPHGRTVASGEQLAAKWKNGKGGTETSGGRRATKRENGTGGRKRRADGAMKREKGTDEKETSSG